ncbi:glycosyltransferase family 4 protein [Massilimicrobiota sp. An80]|uniref:glycosyltransferase family 4 protein n=1 Tax=Massilimicrobiota sp. An80 TaxID=1965658 RepID=UPI000B4423F0|nr:glycosyltransferase family 4 protein [Massilimicrobiota sp. An80]OUN37270.1 capsular biosynthesis protein [Massilimicrobiota sp. An80]
MSRVLFLSNHFITLYSFRKELIRKLCEEGHEVYLSLPKDNDNKIFEEMGCKIVLTEIDRRGVNPKNDLKLIRQYRKLIPQVNPDIIFSYTIKPNIYGSMVANRLHYKQVCNVTGTGATFLKKNMVSRIATFLYRISMKHAYKVFFQNTGDKDYFVEHKMIKKNWEMLPGSGCNLEEHHFVEMPSDEVINFIFIGRVMELKGIDEYLKCAKNIKKKYPNTRFLIAGWNEEEKYKAIIHKYEEKRYVEYIGFRKDIADWIEKCHCTILPSHGGEGVPNVLLETASTGRVCIGSNINGTMDVIEDGKTGYLFETGNATDLTDKVEKFIKLSFNRKKMMGLAGRKKIENEFDRQIVIKKYIDEVKKAGR